MKFILIIVLSVIFASCSSMQYIYENIQVDEDGLRKHVEHIVKTPEPRNYLNIESLNIVAEYIDSVFQSCSERVDSEPFIIEGTEYKNIICSFGPEDGSRIIIGAHYDVCENQPGADDNASGIAGLLELARLFKVYSPQLENRIDLVAFTLEEPPFFRTDSMGSAVHAKKLHDNNIDVKMMICLEMIGYYDDRPNTQQFPIGLLNWFYPDTGNFITVVSNFKSRHIASDIKDIIKHTTNINVEKLSAPAFIPGVDFSDHQNFWKYGIKAVMITDTAFYRNPNYHKTTDTIDTLDFDKMSEVVKGVYLSVIHSSSYL